MQAQVKTLSGELEAERRKFSELHRKSLEVHHMEAALHSLQQELAEETSRSIAMEERLTEALHAEKSSTQAMVDGEMAKLRAARRALENERDAVVAAARKETEEARAALEAERSKSGSMKDRLKEEVMKLMQEREGSLLDHSKRLETALEQAQAEAAASRAEAEQLRAELAAGGGGGGHRQGLPSSRGAAPEDRALTARVEQLAADLGTEKEYSASLERQLKALTAAAGEPGGGMAGASPSPSVSTELTRSREAMARLRDELSGSRQQCAQLQAELAVQASVIERTEAVVGQRHQLAGEVKRLRLQLEEEQQRARETELQLLNEVEILMRDLPGSLRSRSALSGGLMSPAPQEAVM
jgi:chromosome segregation ATPase